MLKERPDVLFVQNPSIVLAAFVSLLKRINKMILVVDRHSNFLLTQNKGRSKFYELVFTLLSNFSIRHADITIVTNEFIAKMVKNRGGVPFILPDKVPLLQKKKVKKLRGNKNIFLISSFGLDEPIDPVWKAMTFLKNKNICLYISGKDQNLDKRYRNNAPENIIFTGFLSEQDFMDMIFSVDAVMVLTTIDHCMLCGCYEAVAAEKPLITSDKMVLRNYFTDMVYVNNSAQGIIDGIETVFDNLKLYEKNSTFLKKHLSVKWNRQKRMFNSELQNLIVSSSNS